MRSLLISLILLISAPVWGQRLSHSRTWSVGRFASLTTPVWDNDTIYALSYSNRNVVPYQNGTLSDVLYYMFYSFNSQLDSITRQIDSMLVEGTLGMRKINGGLMSLMTTVDTTRGVDSIVLRYYNKRGNPLGFAPLDTFLTSIAQKDIQIFETDKFDNVYISGIAVQPGNDWDVFVARFYPNGRLAWARVYEKPGLQDPRRITRDTAEGMLITVDEQFGDFKSLEIDAIGNERAYKLIHHRPRRPNGVIKRLPKFGYAVAVEADSTLILVTDDAGNTIWSRNKRKVIPQSLQIFDDGTMAYYRQYVAVGSPTVQTDSLIKVEALTGREIWKVAISQAAGEPFCASYGFAYTPWGDCYITGVCGPNESIIPAKLWLCKVDSLGRQYDPSAVRPGVWVNRATGLDIAPNPATGAFSVYNLVEGRPEPYVIRDMVGRIVHQGMARNKESIAVGPLQAGTYVVRIGNRSGRLVVQ